MFGPQSRPPAPAPAPAPPFAPLPQAGHASGQTGKKSVLPLILILGGLFLVALLVVLIFVLKK